MKPLLCAAFAILLLACASTPPPDGETIYAGRNILSPSETAAAKRKPDFGAHLKPILETRCVICHNAQELPGRMSLENRRLAMASGMIVPGHPEKSLLVSNLDSKHAGMKSMPPVGERVTGDELAILIQWIKQGAEWPEGRAGQLDPNANLQRE